MDRIIVTGANGAGKSHLAMRLAAARPGIPVVSFDAIKLRTGWRQRPRPEIDAALARAIGGEAWILEGGPSMLPRALERADALVWLDPPSHVRAWRLAMRPWRHRGRTRPELPPGNIDRPWEQYRFALRSLRNGAVARRHVADVVERCDGPGRTWRCRTPRDIERIVQAWAEGASR